MEELRFETPDGVRLAGYRWDPEGDPVAVLQITHGISEHARRYAPVAERFAAEGWVVYAHDHRGHGGSIPEGGVPGHMADSDGWERATEDLHRIHREIRLRHPGLPVVLLAHSGGSFMAQRLLAQYPDDFDLVALSGSNGKPPPIAAAGRLVTRLERWRRGKDASSPLIQKLSFGGFNDGFEGRTEFDWLSSDPAAVDAYVDDPLCGFPLSTQTWTDMLDALPELTKPRQLARIPKDKPIYVFGGDRDPVGDQGAGLRRLVDAYKRAGLQDVTLKLYPGGRHEMLNESNKDEVIGDLAKWIAGRLPEKEERADDAE
ncbi:MAG TPA: alpha/beta hydrolase [Polyangiaceae bacterium LLY-WYZ-15_(1-7)]|nr:hypothetical protein [Myxococcales bacterium]MAT24561.1 hypothetical protein [Sandaracinus sp.]HJK89698.1 alpha/beta hydrolase [Polyangiaceae bacterium LLY-WYZ-15_(1-7)]MBJ71851.1 hypothetical protein [Sandaracinus sp.]HJL03606.1 alpha/beta hydrolase [Polyangiaceae bacterium LLY-WYZ-15_(1-7)]